MSGLISTLITGVTAFIATNLDDIVILMIFFAQLSVNFRVQHIIIGHYLGFTAIILACLPGFFSGLFLPKAWIGLLGLLPIAIGVRQLWNPEDGEQVQMVPYAASERSGLSSLLMPQTYRVAAVTFANGGDNIGVYVPIFASSSVAKLLIILSTFVGMIGIWCPIAFHLSHHPLIAPKLTQYGAALVPYLLIGLGVFILIENHSYSLLPFWRT